MLFRLLADMGRGLNVFDQERDEQMMNRLMLFGCYTAVLGCLGLVTLSGGQAAAVEEIPHTDVFV